MTQFHSNRQQDYLNIKDKEQTQTSFKKALKKILEALYIQKIKETNDDYLSFLNFNEILNLPSLVSESIFNALVTEPRDYIKQEEFVEGLSTLFDKHIDFDFNEKTNVPKVYEILFKIFCLKKKKMIPNGSDLTYMSSDVNLNKTNSSATTERSDAYCFDFHYDLEHFNKIISNILLAYYLKGDNLNIEEFLPFCEEIKLNVKKTFNRNNILNKNFWPDSNSMNFTNISTFKTNNNNILNSDTYDSKNYCNVIHPLKFNDKDLSCINPNIYINPSFNCDSNSNLNLKFNIDNLSTISENNSNIYMNMSVYPQNLRNNKKGEISIEEFIECLQKNSKLLFILLLLFYSLSPVNEKLIYLLTKHPDTKLINDAEEDMGDFIEEDELTQDIQVLPLSYKKVNLGEIKNDSKNNTNLNSPNNNSNKISDCNPNKNSDDANFIRVEKNNSQAKIVFDLSEDSNTFSKSYSDFDNDASGIKIIQKDKFNETINDSSKTISINGGSTINLNNFTNKSKFYNKDNPPATDKIIDVNNQNNAAKSNFRDSDLEKTQKNVDPRENLNIINFNLDDSNSFDQSNTFKSKLASFEKEKNKNYSSFLESKHKLEKTELNSQSSKTNNYDSDTKIIVYRHDKTNESSVNTNNERIFDSSFKDSFEKIVISNRHENQEQNATNYALDDISKKNTVNSIYNDFNELLVNNKKFNNTNKHFNPRGCNSLPSKISTLELNDNLNYSKDKDNLLEDTHSVDKNYDKSLVTYNSNNYNNFKGNDISKRNNNPFAFEEVFSEYKVSVEKVKISKDFIFNTKKCQEFTYHFNNNKSLSFKNFNFNLEDDWLIKNLKEIYGNIINKNVSEIKKFNKHLSFLTVLYQFNDSSEVHKHYFNNDKNNNLFNKENLIKHISINLSKSIADIIDDYLVLFTFNNAFEANLIHNYIQSNKDKVIGKFNALKVNENKNNFNNCKNENEFNLSDKFNANRSYANSNKEGLYGFSDKTTNYKDSNSKLSTINYLVSSKDADYLKSKEKNNFLNNISEDNSEFFSLMDIYESNNFYSLNLKLIVNLRNCKITSFEDTTVNGIKLFPISLKQEENLFVFFFETDIEREILINYHKDNLVNSNPIKDYIITDVISKNKFMEFFKASHKETKEAVEVKKYIKNKIKSSKIVKEINSLRDLSLVHKFFHESKIPKTIYFENADEIFIVYEDNEKDPIKFIFMNPELKITKDVSKYSLNIKKIKELKSMLEMLSISMVPKVNVD